MQPKEIHNYLFKMYDYADYLLDELEKGNCSDANVYIASLACIEDMMDIYGRGLIGRSADDAGLDGRASLDEANRRIDVLRQRMDGLRASYDLDAAITQATNRLQRNWGQWR